MASSLARVVGVVKDSTGNAVPNAKIHVYRGDNDSVEDTTVRAKEDGGFLVDLKPGKVRLFAEKDGHIAQSLGYSELKASEVKTLDTVKLVRVLTGSFTIPGIQGTSFTVRIEGSPLDVSVSSTGTVTFNVVDGLESILSVTYTNKTGVTQVYRFRITTKHGGVSIMPVYSTTDTIAPPKNPIDTTTPPKAKPFSNDSFEIHPGPNDVADCPFIGDFAGTSSWSNVNFGSLMEEGPGGAYDGNTIGRLLWKYDFSSAVPAGRKIRSVKLVWTPLHWGIRPTGGQDLTIQIHRMLVDWKEGHGAGQSGGGEAVSSSNDGASAGGPAYGRTWNKPLVGIDNVDADTLVVAESTLPYLSLSKLSFDITEVVKGWLADPSSNHGLLFNSTHEKDGTYLDYPAFASDDNADSTKRPYLAVQLEPQDSGSSPVDTSTGPQLAILQPGPEGQDDACIIGTFSGNGSHDGNTQGSDPLQSLGGSWDYNTIGRLLWKMNLPDSLKTKTIVSARAVFKVNKWLTRPLGGHDYKIEAYKMLRPWREGTGVFPGQPNNAGLDGASSRGPRFGENWNSTLVGFDGVDAEKTRSSYAVLPWDDTSYIGFDMTFLVKSWLAKPESNNGVIFRSLEELDPSFPNFPGFNMSEATDPSTRPKMVIQYK